MAVIVAALGPDIAIVLHVRAYVVAKQEIGPDEPQFLGMVRIFTGFIGCAALPRFASWVGRLDHATSIPRS